MGRREKEKRKECAQREAWEHNGTELGREVKEEMHRITVNLCLSSVCVGTTHVAFGTMRGY
jgi:hypothetical protein